MFRSITTLGRRKNYVNVIISKEIFPDKATERKILSLTIRCPNNGCEWTGKPTNKKVKLTHISINVNKQLHQHMLLFSSVEITKPQTSFKFVHVEAIHRDDGLNNF